MHRKFVLTLVGAAIVAVGVPAAGALGAGKKGAAVTVRVEGLTRTLLAPKVVNLPTSGSITKGGTPSGACPASSAAGALDVATKHKWDGIWDPKFSNLEVTSVLGETHTFSSPDYWSIWVDNRFAQSGVCTLTLKKGQQLMFAAVPSKGTPYPLSDSAPASVHVGKRFAVKVLWFPAKGNPKPLAGATIKAGTLTATTNSHGVAHLKATKTGKLAIVASKTGYIRTAPLSVRVIP